MTVAGTLLLLACAPQAHVGGEGALAAELRGRLAAHGVVIEDHDPACPATRAHVAREGAALRLELDGGGRGRADRRVQDMETAALLVRSWAHRELPELAPPPPPPEPPPAIAEPERGRAFDVIATAQLGAASDGGRLAGASVTGTLAGLPRPRLAARVLVDPRVPVVDGAPPASRASAELLAGAGLRLDLGPVEVEPHAAAGLGVVWCRGVPDRGFGRSLPGARAELGVALRAVLQPLLIELSVAGSVTPGARTWPAAPASSAGTTAAEQRRRSLPGEPAAALHAGLGLGLRRAP